MKLTPEILAQLSAPNAHKLSIEIEIEEGHQVSVCNCLRPVNSVLPVNLCALLEDACD
jgi:hypothetical protein